MCRRGAARGQGAPLVVSMTLELREGDRFAMRKLLLQLDSSRLPSVFDQIVAYDAGADDIMSYGGVTETDVRDLIHGCIFTRGPKDLKNTAVWIGGSNMSAGEQLLAMAQDAHVRAAPGLDDARLQRVEHHRRRRGGEDRGDAGGSAGQEGSDPGRHRAGGAAGGRPAGAATGRTSRSPPGSRSRARRRGSSSARASTCRSRR